MEYKSFKDFLFEREYMNSSHLFEGGNIFDGTDKIKREWIEPTLNEYYKELSRLFPKKKKVFTKFVPVGSVGKKPYSGDIDLAIDASEFFNSPEVNPKELSDWNISEKSFNLTYEKLKKRAKTASDSTLRWKAFLKELGEYINANSDDYLIENKKTNGGNMFGMFPQYNESGIKQDFGVQMDWMVGNLDWLKFSYYSDAPMKNVKGLHRTQLMLAMFNIMGYTFDHVNGVKDKETKEVVANKSEDAMKLLGKLYGAKLDKKTLQNYDTLHKYLQKNASKKEYEEVLDVYLKIMDRTRADIPWDMQKYWKDNKNRLSLTGKFLPSDSELLK